jgi:hypothetical protein
MAGGVGLRRGRRDEHHLAVGDSLDFWRVLYASKEDRRLLLFAEMKLLISFIKLQPSGRWDCGAGYTGTLCHHFMHLFSKGWQGIFQKPPIIKFLCLLTS